MPDFMGEVVLDLASLPDSPPPVAATAPVRLVRPRDAAWEYYRMLERQASVDKIAAKFVRQRRSGWAREL